MQSQPTPERVYVSADGVCVVDGYGIELRVDRGHLVVADGIGPLRRRSRFSRATSGLQRLVLLGSSGFMSLEAIRWLDEVGVAFVHLSPDGAVRMTSARTGSHDGRMRRAQAQLLGTPSGLEAARSILRPKLKGQAKLVRLIGRPDIARIVDRMSAALDTQVTPADLLVPEAAAANAYWSAWSDVSITWARADSERVPDHWRVFGTRRSGLTGSNRVAANPANAILNYCYALLEAEVRLGCAAVGLDPALGVLHADQRGRDSLVLDLMEPLRPEVDSIVLGLLATRTLRARDFHETRQGNCRILAPLTHELARTTSMWRSNVGPIVEAFAQMVAATSFKIDAIPTPLTQANRSAGRASVRRRPRATIRMSDLARTTCTGCGGRVVGQRRYCDACRPETDAFQRVGVAALAQRRRAGADPAHGGEVARIRGDKWRERMKVEAEWERKHGKADPAIFQLEILPAIQAIPTRTLVEATGLTRAYCARVLKGERVPHPRHWDALAVLAAKTAPIGIR
jgi:CRISPR-associated endonuclease Cas1